MPGSSRSGVRPAPSVTLGFGMVIVSSILGAASFYPKAPADNAPWDVLYVTAGVVVMLLLIVLAATWMNARDARRS